MLKKVLSVILGFAMVLSISFTGTVNEANAAVMRRPISNTNPVFLLTVASNQPQSTATTVWATVPDDLKPYTMLSLYHSAITTEACKTWFDQQLTICDQLGIKANLQIANGWEGTVINAAWVESMFQKHTSFVGPLFAELYGTKYDMVASMINLCATYGGVTFNIDYTNSNNGILSGHSRADMLTAMRANPDNYIPIAKQTTNSRYHETEAICAGVWASGLSGNWGTNPDTWTWWETGRAEQYGSEPGRRGADCWKCIVTYPEAQVSEVMLQSALAGATVFANFEHYSYTHYYDGAKTPCFDKEIIPTMRYIINKSLIPTRVEARSMMKAAWYCDNNQINNDYYSNLYAEGTNIDWLRTSGRYYLIPLLVGGTNATERSYFPNVLTTSQYKTTFPTEQNKVNYFNSIYPINSTGSATAQYYLNKWYVQNNLENTNANQRAVLSTRVNTVDTIDMTMPPNTYSVVQESVNSLNFRIGNYNVKKNIWNQSTWAYSNCENWLKTVYQVNPDESDLRTTVIKVKGHTGGSKPVITIAGYNGYNTYTYTENWDATNKLYTISITHNGMIDLTINASGSNTTHPSPASPVTSIKVTAAGGAASIANGATLQMSADVQPAEAANKNVTWSVTNGTGSATINQTGMLTAVSSGIITVSATANDGSNIVGQKNIYITSTSDATTYLSDMTWISATCGWDNHPVQKDLSVGANTLNINGTTYTKGLGTHANSEIVYALGGNYKTFMTTVGIDSENGTNGSDASVDFKVYVDNVLKATSDTMYRTTAGQELVVDVTGASQIKLVAGQGVNNFSDHADWANARLTYDSQIVVEGEAGTYSGVARTGSNSAASGGQVASFIGNGAANYSTYTVNAPTAGTYTMAINSFSDSRNFFISVNGGTAQQVTVNGTSWSVPTISTLSIQLNAGSNTIKFYNNSAYAPDLDKFTLRLSTPVNITVEGESGTYSGTVVTGTNSAASGGQIAGYIGNGAANYSTYTVNAPTAGTYTMTINSFCDSRNFFISVNGGAGQQVAVNGSWSAPTISTLSVQLNTGNNTIKFYNNSAYAPDLDKFTILN